MRVIEGLKGRQVIGGIIVLDATFSKIIAFWTHRRFSVDCLSFPFLLLLLLVSSKRRR
ncbi:hypothetical protein SERLADRAFT_477596 [Serpula lacrymans var. lacrymans S7.9]|uniref:Uncharacterized protein n=1 Tax=Serpula lacrymans var. lacrymans (strain S7.9) TaxID=578457 RepID=F8P988_SERL9|nr:uncharacterized protein SERLADRAFT_477596 [Serpula lacrymans var. lacrymans S7.9]EGO20217.1 hypothetical protein SERLADRAFT_477596 [Serpula lacrymans var. lacrymans S7.9]